MRPTSLRLLLSDSETGETPWAGEAGREAAERSPRPAREPLAERKLDAPDRDPNDLAAQRWGVIVPPGERGTELLAAVSELVGLREEEQHARARRFDVDTKVDPATWHDSTYLPIPSHERPRYLLILGDAEEVSFELQMGLARAGALVGRLAFSDLAQYRAYARKVVRCAESGAGDRPDMLFHTATDSPATVDAAARLVEPCARAACERRGARALDVREIVPLAHDPRRPAEWADDAAARRAAVLLTASHGVGVKAGAAGDEARRLQGALQLGPDLRADAAFFADRTFLPGGLWFCFACFGAGTPRQSAYQPWLRKLAAEHEAYSALASAALDYVPGAEKPGEAFVAALPQAALASPGGPLGFVGHVDLAWSYSYERADRSGASTHDRVFEALVAWAGGSRAATGLEAVSRAFCGANLALTQLDEMSERARLLGKDDPVEPTRRADLWMLRNDLGGFVLLGDPAARLSLSKNVVRRTPQQDAAPEVMRGREERAAAAAVASSAPGAAAPAKATPAPEEGTTMRREQAVIELLGGRETPLAIAARYGVALGVLWRWLDLYRAAGRAALGSED